MHDQRVAQAFAVDQQRSSRSRSVSRFRCGTENETWTSRMLPKVPEAGVQQDVADLGQHLARRRVDADSGSGGSSVSNCFSLPAACVVEDQQRIAARPAGEDLVHARDVALDDFAAERDPTVRRSDGSRRAGTSSSTRWPVSCDSDAAARPKPMFSSSISASCWAAVSSITPASPARRCTAVSRSSASTGLVRKPAAPASSTISRDEVCTSAETHDDARPGSISRSLVEHLEPVHALHHQVEHTTSGFSTK